MNQIKILQARIRQEIIRLEQTSSLNLEEEQKKFRVYEAVTEEIKKSCLT